MQNIVNKQVLNHLFTLAAHEGNYSQINAIVNSNLEKIGTILRPKKSNGVQKMVDAELIKSISDFKKNPSKFTKIKAPKIPDGSPIGME